MQRSVIAIALVVVFSNNLLGPVHATTDESTPMPASLPSAEAPFGLGAVALPDTRSGIVALFACLPHAVDGKTQQAMQESSVDRVIVSYGELDPIFGPPLTLQAVNLQEGDFFPRDFTAGRYVAFAAQDADGGAMASGRDGNIVWLRAETTAAVAGDDRRTPQAARPLYSLAWGEVDSPWLFTAAASTPEGLAALATAFVMAGAPTTPRAGC